MQNLVKDYWWIGLIILAGFIVAARFVAPPPPKQITFAGGSSGGAYEATALSYKSVFDKEKVGFELITTSGTRDNIERLMTNEAQAAIVQGGVATPEQAAELLTLGAIFFEPLWVFYRSDLTITDLRDLNGLQVSGGAAGSGTRAFVETLYDANGLPVADLAEMTNATAAAVLKAGEIDAMLSVAAPNAAWTRDMLADPSISVLTIPRALAYQRLMPYLQQVILPEGAVDLQANLPESEIGMIAPAAQVVVRKDLHPAVQSLLVETMVNTHAGGTLLSEPGAFPNPDRIDLELAKEAKRYYEDGPSFLRRVFSFSVANFLERAWIFVIPLITLAIPLAQAAPPIYRWRTRRKIYIWYRDLRRLEAKGRATKLPLERERIRDHLFQLQAEVGRVEVPESYTDELFRLRSHIAFVSHLLSKVPLEDDDLHIPAA